MTLNRLLCVAFLAVLFSGASQAAGTQPNILFILTDDQGYGDIERHGHPLLKTPHMNRLYDESVRFERFYVSPSCSPTRAALLTGMHEFRSGITHTIHPREHLFKGAVTLPDLLKTSGYRTGIIGKWHLGGTDKGYTPEERGFDFVSNTQGDAFSGILVRDGKRVSHTPGKFREDIYFEEAMHFMEQSGDKPFFCYLATISPHTPLGAPEEFVAPFRGKVTDKQAAYLGMVANIDHNLGRVLKFLEERKLDKNTIVVFMNDNGQTEGLDVYNAGMRGGKCTAWEGGCRAFSFWRWPDRWKPHRVDNLSAHLDVLPTLCDFAGVQIPEPLRPQLEGFSLKPLLESAAPMSWHDDRMLFHHVARWEGGFAASHKDAMCSVHQGDYLLVRSRPCEDPRCAKSDSQCNSLRMIQNGAKAHTYTENNAQYHWGLSAASGWSLYDVKKDPGCTQDLGDRQADRVKKMSAAYINWWDDTFPVMMARGGDFAEPAAASGK